MTREEISRYLGLQIETVSRTMSRLQNLGVLTITDNRNVALKDSGYLQRAMSIADSECGKRPMAFA